MEGQRNNNGTVPHETAHRQQQRATTRRNDADGRAHGHPLTRHPCQQRAHACEGVRMADTTKQRNARTLARAITTAGAIAAGLSQSDTNHRPWILRFSDRQTAVTKCYEMLQ